MCICAFDCDNENTAVVDVSNKIANFCQLGKRQLCKNCPLNNQTVKN